MNLDLLMRGFSRCEVVVGKQQSVERILRTDLRNPIVRVRLNYYCSELKKFPILPWKAAEVNIIWFIRTVCMLNDGQVIYHDSAITGPLEAALDQAYLRGVQAVLDDVITHKQHILEESA